MEGPIIPVAGCVQPSLGFVCSLIAFQTPMPNAPSICNYHKSSLMDLQNNKKANGVVAVLGCDDAVTMKAKRKTVSSSHTHSPEEQFGQVPLMTAVLTYISYLILNILGRFQDFLRRCSIMQCNAAGEPMKTRNFVPLYSSFEAFYTRNLYRRVQDCWNRPICSSPGVQMTVLDRHTVDNGWTLK